MRESAVPVMLPHEAPSCPYAALLLFGMRRMAAGGVGDAHAAHAFLTGFGMGYRRPLVLLRAFMTELSRVSAVRLVVAPCCCRRASEAEYRILSALASAQQRPDEAHATLCRLLHVRECLGLVTSAQAVAAAFHDGGMPLSDDCNSCTYDDTF